MLNTNVKDSPIIQIRELSKAYTHKILNNINLDIYPGITVIMGRSGSGKSTLLNIIGGLDNADSGTIQWLDDTTLHYDMTAKIRAVYMGFVFQSHYLISDLSVVENVMCPASILHPKNVAEAMAHDALKRIGIHNLANRSPLSLSGGEQQRVSIARAIVNNPKVLLADEPTGNLDEITAEKILTVFEDLKSSGTTIITVTHSAQVRQRACRVYLLENNEYALSAG